MTHGKQGVTENGQNVTEVERDTSSRARTPLKGNVTVVTRDKQPCDVTERRDSDSRSASGSGDRHHHADTWVLCWSKNQNALHVETLAQHLSLNRECYTENLGGDFRLLLIGTQDEVSAAAEAVRSTLAAREVFRVRRSA